MGKVGIFRDLTKPDKHAALSVKPIDRAQRFEKGLLRDFLRKGLISCQGQHIPVNIPKISLINILKINHLLTSLSPVRLSKFGFVTKISKKIRHSHISHAVTHQVFFKNVVLHLGQVTFSLPLPFGRRSVCLQVGQLR